MHHKVRWWLVLSTFSLAVGVASAQPPGPPFGGSRRFRGFDPQWLFNLMDRNRDGVVTRDEIVDRRSLDRYEDYLRRAGVTDGRLTRETFLRVFRERMEERMRSRFDPRSIFRRLDRNRDGKLDSGEIERTRRLREEVPRWDANRDGTIDATEFGRFFDALNAERMPRRSLGFRPPPPPPSSENPPSSETSSTTSTPTSTQRPPQVVYRAGKLPPDLPEWYTDLDTDNDGQVGLHEWRNRSPDEFDALDRNRDGYITIAEMLWHAKRASSRTASREGVHRPVVIGDRP